MGGCQGKPSTSTAATKTGQHRVKAVKTAPTSAPVNLKRPRKSDEHKSKQQVIEDLGNELSQQKLVCELQAKDIQSSQTKLQERTSGFEAMVVLFKYITENLDNTRCPDLKKRLGELSEQLGTAQQQLEGAARLQRALEANMKMAKEQHQLDVFNLKSTHEKAMRELKAKLQRDAEMEKENVEAQHKQTIVDMQQQTENLVRGLDSFEHLSEMKIQHDSEIAVVTQEYEVKLEGLKSEFTHQLEALKKSYEGRINNVTKNYEEIKDQLKEKNVQIHLEYQELLKKDRSGVSTPDGSRCSTVLSHKYLEREVESLRAVMELRNQEINQLRSHNDNMEKQLEEIPKAQMTITALQQKIENLEAIINLKADYEKDLAEKHNVLLRKYDQETKAKKRLSMNNEELAYKLSRTAGGGSETESEIPSASQNLNAPKAVLASSGSNSLTSTPSKTKDHRPKSMVSLPQHSHLPADRTSSKQSGPPVSAKPPGIKLRRPKMFPGSPDENVSSETASDDKQDSAFRQSDV